MMRMSSRKQRIAPDSNARSMPVLQSVKSASAVTLRKVPSQTHVRGVLQASSNSASGLPAAGF